MASSAGGPPRPERRTGEDPNRSRRGRRSSPRKELKGVSPEKENRRRPDLGEDGDGGGNRGVGARVWDKGGRDGFKGRGAGDRCDGEGGRRGGQSAVAGLRKAADVGGASLRGLDSQVTHRPTRTPPGDHPTRTNPDSC